MRGAKGDHTAAQPERLTQGVSCATVLQASAEVLATAAHRPTYATRQRLAGALRELDQHHANMGVFLRVVAAVPAESLPRHPHPDGHSHPDGTPPGVLRPSVAHELAYTTRLAGQTVAVSAAADARPLVDRLLGRRAPGSVDGSIAAAHRIAMGHITRRSVWFQNSVRGALGLSIAVLLAEVTQIAHGFWVVLGAMSVLRTTALTTGSTALRALTGTLVGFVAGAGIILLVGTTAWHLWLLLPFVVLIAAYLPEAVSFVAGQAAFTVMVVILFNIIQPVGWTVGLVRIEDIALGCAAGLISGLLLWPRGASAQIRAALADNYRRSADALEVATGRVTGRRVDVAGTLDEVMSTAKAAGRRLDDAFREYLFERGTKSVPVAELTAVSNGASRVRLAAEAIAVMTNPVRPPPAGHPSPDPENTPTPDPEDPPSTPLATSSTTVADSAADAAQWFQEIANVLHRTPPDAVLPAGTPVRAEAAVLGAFREDPRTLRNPNVAARASSLWTASLYIDDVTRLQSRLGRYVAILDGPSRPGAPMTDETDPAPADGRPAAVSAP